MSEQAKWPEAWVVFLGGRPRALTENPADWSDCRRVALLPVADAALMERELAEAKGLATREILKRQRNDALDRADRAESEAAALRERVAELERIVEPLAGVTVEGDGFDGGRPLCRTWGAFFHVIRRTVAEADRIRARKSEQRPEAGEAGPKPERMVFRGPNLTADGGPGPIERMFLGDADRRWIVPDADLSTRVAALEAWREASEGRGVELTDEDYDKAARAAGYPFCAEGRGAFAAGWMAHRSCLAEARRRGFVGGEGKA